MLVSSRRWLGLSEQQQEGIKVRLHDEILKQNPKEDCVDAISLIAQMSINVLDDGGKASVVVIDGQGRPRLRSDGQPYSLGELATELRVHYPTLFKLEEAPAARREQNDQASTTSNSSTRGRPQHEVSLSARLKSADLLTPRNLKMTTAPAGNQHPGRSPPLPVRPFSLPPFWQIWVLYGAIFVALASLLWFGISEDVFRPPPDNDFALTKDQGADLRDRNQQSDTVNTQAVPLSLRGLPEVIDTSAMLVGGRLVRLFGMEWAPGGRPDDLVRYISGREITCTVADAQGRFRCHVDGRDLSEVVLFNGGGRATSDATPELKAAERRARQIGAGVWKTQ